jgi:cobaltochelatase CobS
MTDKTFEEALRKKILDSLNGGGAEQKTPEKPKPSPKLFNKGSKTDTKGMLELADIIGSSHSNGKKYYWPVDIKKTPEHWDVAIRHTIPVPSTTHVPDYDYCVDILDAIAYNKVLMAKGYPGTGKDSTIEWIAGLLNYPYMREDGMEGIDSGEILGYTVPDGSGGYTEMQTTLWRMAKYGGLYVRSEPFACSASVNMAMQSLLEPQRLYKVPGHPDPTKGNFRASDCFRLFLTTNARGTGDDIDRFAATTVQDQSTLNRVDIHAEVGYLLPEREVAMLQSAYPDMTEVLAKKMVKLAGVLRDAWKQGTIELPFSPRQLLEWGSVSMRHGEVERGFKQCYYNGLNDDEKGEVKRHWLDVDFNAPLT